MFDAFHADSNGLVDRRGRMRVCGHRQTGGVCLLDQRPQSSIESCGANTSVTMPPLPSP